MHLYLPPLSSPKLHKSMFTFMTTKFIILDGVYINNSVNFWATYGRKGQKTHMKITP